MPLDQSRNPNFQVMQAAGAAGRFAGTVLDDFGKSAKADTNNIQPRLGVVYDLRGDGHDVVRGGWGVYTDFAYTNQNALNAAIDAQGGGGIVFLANNPSGIRKADGTFFRASDPLSTIANQNLVNPNLPPLAGQVQSPRLQQPYTRQANVGWVHQLDSSTALSVDVVRADGRNVNTRLRINQIVNGRRYLADLPIQPNSNAFRVALSEGHEPLPGARRRLEPPHVEASGRQRVLHPGNATSVIGSAADETDANLVQDVRDPFGDVQNAPLTRTDARHRISASAIVEVPFGINIAPIFLYQSALPTHSFEGLDLNADGNNNDKTARAYRYTGLNADGTATFKEAGDCQTVNCSWRAPYSQMNLRVSKSFALGGASRVEAIAEVFNLFNAKNPSIPLTTRRLGATGAPLASFMQPTAYAGDFGQPEQRVGQIRLPHYFLKFEVGSGRLEVSSNLLHTSNFALQACLNSDLFSASPVPSSSPNRLDEHGARRHRHGRTTWAGGDCRHRHGQRRFHRHHDLRRRADARRRRARLTRDGRRPSRRRRRWLHQARHPCTDRRADHHGGHVDRVSDDRRLGAQSADCGSGKAVSCSHRARRAAADALLGVQALSPGHSCGAADDLRAYHGEPGERRRECGSHLRLVRHAGAGRGRLRLVHVYRPRLSGGVLLCGDPSRASQAWRRASVRAVLRSTLTACGTFLRSAPQRQADYGGGQRLRTGDRTRGAARRGVLCLSPDRFEHRPVRVSWCRSGLASAGACASDTPLGARDMRRARHAGWTALLLGGTIMVMLGACCSRFLC
jgi:hypothetical protein